MEEAAAEGSALANLQLSAAFLRVGAIRSCVWLKIRSPVCRAGLAVILCFPCARGVLPVNYIRSHPFNDAMARPTGYRWDAPAAVPGLSFRPQTTAWDLRWWILAAVATSIAVNGALLVWMENQRLQLTMKSEDPDLVRTGVFDLEQVTIPQDVLDRPSNEPPDLSKEVNNEPPVKDLPTIDQLAEALKNENLLMTPVLKEMAANVTLSKPAAGTAGDLVDDFSKTKSALDVSVKDSLLSNAGTLKPTPMKPDVDQMLVDPNVLNSGTGSVKDDINRAMKKGKGGNNGLDGFNNLDDLVNFKGPIVGDFKTMLRTDLLFDFGSAQLRSEARLSLMKLGMIIQTNERAIFRLVGHTDTIGDDVSNQLLSEARARAVKNWLVTSLQIDGGRIRVEGRGEREPLPDVPRDGDANAQQLNRRVEIHKTGG